MRNGLSLNLKKTTIIKLDSDYQTNALFQVFYKDKVYKKK